MGKKIELFKTSWSKAVAATRKLFTIQKEERWLACCGLLYCIALQVLMFMKYGERFMARGAFWEHIVKDFNISGFDPYVDLIVSQWRVMYALFRHPLISVFLYPFTKFNEMLMAFGLPNCAFFITATVYTILGVYSMLWLFRTLRHVVGLAWGGAMLLTAWFFSFASIMLAVFVPDHFAISLCVLILTTYLSGMCMLRGRMIKWWQLALMFTFSAGVTLTNSVKIILSALFVNRRAALRPRFWLLAFVLPATLMFGTYKYIYDEIYMPERQAIEANEIVRAQKDKKFANQRKRAKKREAERRKHQIAEGDYFQWTDKDLSRTRSITENIFGESVQLHQDHLLKDVNRGRPVFVSYDYWAQYIVVALVILLFLAGVVAGIREPLMWMLLSWFVFDMTIHLGLGFGLTEVSIMGAHWMFIIPIGTAYLLRRMSGHWKVALQTLIGLLALYLIIYNGSLLVKYMTL